MRSDDLLGPAVILGALLCVLVALGIVLFIRRKRAMPHDPCSPDAPRSSSVVCFLDESATDSRTLEHGVLGGMVTNWSLLPEFTQRWDAMLTEHQVPGGLHMKEFGRHGRLRRIKARKKKALLTDAVAIINDIRIHTVGAQINNRAYENAMSADLLEDVTSVYNIGFMMCVVANHKTAANQGYGGTIDYILDDGNSKKLQVQQSHAAMTQTEEMRGDAYSDSPLTENGLRELVEAFVALKRRTEPDA